MRVERNIVLTGLGQSGTTLACHLLNKVPDTVALSEHIAPAKFEDLMPDTGAVCDGIQDFFERMRSMALKRGEVISKHKGGVVPSACLLDEPLESHNLNPFYDRDDMLRIGERLLASDGAYWRFYTKESVEGLLAAV